MAFQHLHNSHHFPQIKGRQVTPPCIPMLVYIYSSPLQPEIFFCWFRLSGNCQFPFLSDFALLLSTIYGVLIKKLKENLEVKSKPSLIVRRCPTTCHPVCTRILQSIPVIHPYNRELSPLNLCWLYRVQRKYGNRQVPPLAMLC